MLNQFPCFMQKWTTMIHMSKMFTCPLILLPGLIQRIRTDFRSFKIQSFQEGFFLHGKNVLSSFHCCRSIAYFQPLYTLFESSVDLRFFALGGAVGSWRSSTSSTSLLWTSIKPWKYLTVRTLNSIVASSSTTKVVCGCCWKADTVHMWFTPSSIACRRACAFFTPLIKIRTW